MFPQAEHSPLVRVEGEDDDNDDDDDDDDDDDESPRRKEELEEEVRIHDALQAKRDSTSLQSVPSSP